MGMPAALMCTISPVAARNEVSRPLEKWNSAAGHYEPYCLPHSVARSHSSLVVRLSAFPISGRGLGPGGNFLAAALRVRASTERVATAPASVTVRKSTVIVSIGERCERRGQKIISMAFIL